MARSIIPGASSRSPVAGRPSAGTGGRGRPDPDGAHLHLGRARSGGNEGRQNKHCLLHRHQLIGFQGRRRVSGPHPASAGRPPQKYLFCRIVTNGEDGRCGEFSRFSVLFHDNGPYFPLPLGPFFLIFDQQNHSTPFLSRRSAAGAIFRRWSKGWPCHAFTLELQMLSPCWFISMNVPRGVSSHAEASLN
jgi:hypothetical protein